MGYLTSSVGRKQLMGLSGLALSLFVLSHMAGNMLILAGADAYNTYAHTLVSTKLIYIAEAGLVAMFVLHIVLAYWLTLENRRARPHGYYQDTGGTKAVSIASKTMVYQGTIILAFTILHLATFKYGTVYQTSVDGVPMRDLHRLVIEIFQQPGYVVWYIISLLALSLHLSHGFASSFQSLGFNHPRYQPWIKKFGCVYALIVTLGFISQPLYVVWTQYSFGQR